ncbi:hypothetical protein CHCC15091_3669 [Bacillus licheniformis]|nr:hypothetical protein B4089_3194 [Bacillus licheniformis]TWK08223.1 hypothetical protein CHCC20487_0635 [Bacillus licheniformis]TWM11782.1 hypothetical protein CHCC15091_3669 [Bacillus licheniformis]
MLFNTHGHTASFIQSFFIIKGKMYKKTALLEKRRLFFYF